MTNFVVFTDIYRQFDMSVDNTDTNNHDNQYSYLLYNIRIQNFNIVLPYFPII